MSKTCETRYALFLYGERVSEPQVSRSEAIAEAYELRPAWHLIEGYQIREHKERADENL